MSVVLGWCRRQHWYYTFTGTEALGVTAAAPSFSGNPGQSNRAQRGLGGNSLWLTHSDFVPRPKRHAEQCQRQASWSWLYRIVPSRIHHLQSVHHNFPWNAPWDKAACLVSLMPHLHTVGVTEDSQDASDLLTLTRATGSADVSMVVLFCFSASLFICLILNTELQRRERPFTCWYLPNSP